MKCNHCGRNLSSKGECDCGAAMFAYRRERRSLLAEVERLKEEIRRLNQCLFDAWGK